MKLTVKVLIVSTAILILPNTVMAGKVTIDQQTIKAKKICGKKYGKTDCKTTRHGLTLRQNDIPVDVNDEQPDWLAVLGKMVVNKDGEADRRGTLNSLTVCSEDGIVKFNASNISDITPPTNFTFKKQSDFKAYADADFDVDALLLGAGVPADKVLPLESKFKAMYNKAANKKWYMKGQYFRVNLTSSTFNQIKAVGAPSGAAKSCGNRVRTLNARPGDNYNMKVIYSVSVIKLDQSSYSSDIASKLALDFTNYVKKKVSDANITAISAGISNDVKTSLEVKTGQQIRIIAWDYLSMNPIDSL